PQKQQAVTLANTDFETNLAISYQAFKILDWTIKYAGGNMLVGYTRKKWYGNEQEIIVSIERNLLNVTSKMIKGEMFDALGKNQKNINAFLSSFESAQREVTNDVITENKNDIAHLTKVTFEQAEEAKNEAIELREAMNLGGDWWRLITNLFIHFGIIHLLANMYALYFIAIYLESMLGKQKYIAAYLCTGVFGS